LNAVVHPRVFAEHDRLLAALPPDTRVVVTDATLLVESGYHLRFDRLVVTHCSSGQQRARLMARDGLTEEQAGARVAAQMPVEEKVRFAHWMVDTSGSEDGTDRAAVALADALLRQAQVTPKPARLDPARAALALERGPRVGPRGLTPLRLAAAVAQSGVPPLPALARAFDPPWTGPWYEAARPEAAGPGAETLAVPVVLGALAFRGIDLDYLLAAAYSTARLTHQRPETIAAALAAALALLEVHGGGGWPPDLGTRVSAHAERIERWAGTRPPTAFLSRLDAGPTRAAVGTFEAALAAFAGDIAAGASSSEVVAVVQAILQGRRL
jgi:hypothetical protein